MKQSDRNAQYSNSKGDEELYLFFSSCLLGVLGNREEITRSPIIQLLFNARRPS